MINESWGIRPILFTVGSFKVPSYTVFISLALIVGFLVYLYQKKNNNIENPDSIYIVVFALTFGIIGAKLLILIIYWKEISNSNSLAILNSGKTIVGGLLGGMVGTILAKKLFKIKARMGNELAIPVLSGMIVGRIGCFLNGCCYGEPTHLLYGVNFGDGILRHPTQIYEIIFDLMLLVYLNYKKRQSIPSGRLFELFLTYYMSFRFLLEYIRVEKIVFLGFTAFQLLCIVTVFYVNRNYIIRYLKRKVAINYERN